VIAAGWAYTFPVFRSAIAADVYTYAALAGIVTTLTVPALDGVNVQKIGASRGRTTGTMMPDGSFRRDYRVGLRTRRHP